MHERVWLRWAEDCQAFAIVLLSSSHEWPCQSTPQAPWTGSNARAVEQRGPLSDAERANIEIFEKVSPSVVQVVAAQSTANPLSEETEGGVASGTGFVWDNSGHKQPRRT
jgi:S1-C subfamily serine protease